MFLFEYCTYYKDLVMNIAWHGGVSYTSQNKDKIPNYAGIYVVTDMNGKVYYVGQANDLQRRFCEHLCDSEPNTGLKNFIRRNMAKVFWVGFSNKDDRNGVELFLFNKLSPALNDAVPCGKVPIPVSW